MTINIVISVSYPMFYISVVGMIIIVIIIMINHRSDISDKSAVVCIIMYKEIGGFINYSKLAGILYFNI